MKKILLVDDSALMRRVMSDIIKEIDGYMVAYTVTDGVQACQILERHDDVDIVLTDIDMPYMNGLELLQRAKEKAWNPAFIVFSSRQDEQSVLNALDLGAIEFIKKPQYLSKQRESYAEKVKKALQMASDVIEKSKNHKRLNTQTSMLAKKHKSLPDGTDVRRLVAIVCSTGGPRALQSLLPKLPKQLAAPIVIVQHMPEGFTNSLALRLNEQCALIVKEAEDGEKVKAGVVYLARGGKHLIAKQEKNKVVLKYQDTPPIGGLKPCGNILLKSLSGLPYDEMVCVILTGMGADGTKGILELEKSKPIYVVAQDENSSTVYGMPRAVYEAGVCDKVCDLDDIANEIIKKVGVL